MATYNPSPSEQEEDAGLEEIFKIHDEDLDLVDDVDQITSPPNPGSRATDPRRRKRGSSLFTEIENLCGIVFS